MTMKKEHFDPSNWNRIMLINLHRMLYKTLQSETQVSLFADTNSQARSDRLGLVSVQLSDVQFGGLTLDSEQRTFHPDQLMHM